jgi:CRISPR-associated protein Csy2
MLHDMPEINGLLVLPRLRVQNANAISSPLTWGFPSITAFTGFMHALERKLGADSPLNFNAIGVICHAFEPQTTEGGFTRAFRLTRNPVNADGSSAALVEEGRAHLDITLVLGFSSDTLAAADETTRQQTAQRVADAVAGMRLAGGSVMPALPLAGSSPRRRRPEMLPWPLHYQAEKAEQAWKRLRQRWLPGFALVARDDLLAARLAELQTQNPSATLLDAWLDASRLNHRAVRVNAPDAPEQVAWQRDARPGWIVPIPVGYAALSELHEPGTVAGARDRETPFRFVESVYSLGQWIGPHRLNSAQDLLWWSDFDADAGLYRCRNAYRPNTPPAMPASDPAEDSTQDPDSPFAYV